MIFCLDACFSLWIVPDCQHTADVQVREGSRLFAARGQNELPGASFSKRLSCCCLVKVALTSCGTLCPCMCDFDMDRTTCKSGSSTAAPSGASSSAGSKVCQSLPSLVHRVLPHLTLGMRAAHPSPILLGINSEGVLLMHPEQRVGNSAS